MSDSIPVLKAIDDGNEKVVVILTRDADYRKSPNSMMGLIKMKYRKYPGLVNDMRERHTKYNETLENLERLEKEGKIFVIRPKQKVEVGRLEKDGAKMTALYDCGYKDADECFDELAKYLGVNIK